VKEFEAQMKHRVGQMRRSEEHEPLSNFPPPHLTGEGEHAIMSADLIQQIKANQSAPNMRKGKTGRATRQSS
jgi:hypothetical protein